MTRLRYRAVGAITIGPAGSPRRTGRAAREGAIGLRAVERGDAGVVGRAVGVRRAGDLREGEEVGADEVAVGGAVAQAVERCSPAENDVSTIADAARGAGAACGPWRPAGRPAEAAAAAAPVLIRRADRRAGGRVAGFIAWGAPAFASDTEAGAAVGGERARLVEFGAGGVRLRSSVRDPADHSGQKTGHEPPSGRRRRKRAGQPIEL